MSSTNTFSLTRYRWVGLALALIAVLVVARSARPAQALATGPVDFESSFPAGWFVYSGGASSVTPSIASVGMGDSLVRPGQIGTNAVLTVQYAIDGWGGFGNDLALEGGAQDWSRQDGLSLWFRGSNSGLTYQVDIMDNRSDPNSDTAERFSAQWLDNSTGWRRVTLPWSAFTRGGFQPGGAPNDGLTLTEMWGWAVVLPGTGGAPQTFSLDDVSLIDHVIDDFETPLASGTDANGVPVGFLTFNGAGSTIAISRAATPPAPVSFPLGAPNSVLQVDVNVSSYAGFIHNFENATANAWVPQNWNAYEGFAFWIYGQNTGTTLFIDILENRNPGSTSDDAERWTASFPDNFSGWRYVEFSFEDLTRKDVGNGAPNDGLLLNEVYGWAFGTLGTPSAVTYYIDQVTLFGDAAARPLEVSFDSASFGVTEGGTATITARISRAITDSDPATVTVDYALSPGTAVEGTNYVNTSGTLTFVNGGPTTQTFTVQTLDNTKYTGGRSVIMRLSNASGAELSSLQQAVLWVNDDEEYDPLLLDDFETAPYLWDATQGVSLSSVSVPSGDPLAQPGQGAAEGILSVSMPTEVKVKAEKCNNHHNNHHNNNGVLTVAILSTRNFDATQVDHATVRYGNASETHINRRTGVPQRHVEDVDRDRDLDLVIHVRAGDIGFPCNGKIPLTGATFTGQPIANNVASSFYRDFADAQDWSEAEALSFWYYGQNSGDRVRVVVKDNGVEAAPSGWQLQWADEFNSPAGTPPNPANWSYEIGDGAINGIEGWGNSELQYYTNSTENSATDGNGNLVITVREADGSYQCYYGACEYTSARLISSNKAEFAYGRIEARIKVAEGAGLWPAFWALGTDIGQVGWPQSGEIDIMEFVGREPNQVFGTIHGPGYNGGNAFGNVHTFANEVPDDFHTFAVEWEPDQIRWYVDGINYHQADPADVAPDEWVFNHAFFLLLNVAVGGNFGGPVGEDTTFPQAMTVDYVRVYGSPDNAERFKATFVDNFTGWQKITVPFSSFTRMANQPAGAPDDGLNLTAVNGYGFTLPNGSTASTPIKLDQVRLVLPPPPTALTVTTNANDGTGSLRWALSKIASGGTISFDPSLAGQTITLSGVLTLDDDVIIDASAAPGLTISGNNTDRVFIVNAGVDATITHVTISNGFGWDLAGGILNNGTLTLNYSTVSNNAVGADAGDFWKGGGGIYNGDGSTLNLNFSTVANNTTTLVDGGGIYGFFNTTLNISNSTIKDNIAGNVGGGFRTLGNATITNSTITGNQAQAWYGAAVFHTDGIMNLINSTVANNIGPGWAPEVLFVGTFTPASATLNLTNTIVANNTAGCFVAPWGSGVVTLASGGNNIGPASCNLVGPNDQPDVDPLLGPLGTYGGSTLTYSLLPGSPAIDAGNPSICPATDQRGVSRPQGPVCDIGAYEYQP